MVIRLPFVIGICFVVLFAYLGLSFLAGIVIFVVTFFTNLYLTRVMASLQGEFMRRQDRRVRAVIESLSNIKMLKMHAWTPIFQRLISERRAEEI